ncbi:hypothetical protein JC221_184 [Yersinia phage JC221]|nr:hypothetical protein JC221_184 [Yersinia phage JC221]
MTELTEFEKRVLGCLMVMMGFQLSVMNADLLLSNDLCAIWMASLSILYSSFGFNLITNDEIEVKVEVETENKRWVYE